MGKKPKEPPERLRVFVYLDDGHVFETSSLNIHAARSLCVNLSVNGHCVFDDSGFNWYPPHRIVKIRVFGRNIDAEDMQAEIGTRIH